jgi:hypothetical protein
VTFPTTNATSLKEAASVAASNLIEWDIKLDLKSKKCKEK